MKNIAYHSFICGLYFLLTWLFESTTTTAFAAINQIKPLQNLRRSPTQKNRLNKL